MSSPDVPQFSVARKGYDPEEVDEYAARMSEQAHGAADRIAALETDLKEAIRTSADLERRLEEEAQRTTALNGQLTEAREQEDAVRLMLHEAAKTKATLIAEGEETAHRLAAEATAEAARIVQQAQDEIAGFEQTRVDQLRALEAEADEEKARLQEEIVHFEDRLRLASSLYDQLQATLRLVATTSIEELTEAQRTLAPLNLASPSPVVTPPAADAMEDTAPVVRDELRGGIASHGGEDSAEALPSPDDALSESDEAASSTTVEEPEAPASLDTTVIAQDHELESGRIDTESAAIARVQAAPADHEAPHESATETSRDEDEIAYRPTTDEDEHEHAPELMGEVDTEAPVSEILRRRTANDDEDEEGYTGLPHLGDAGAREAHDMARSLRKAFTS